jgi:hypothetical protein
MYPFNWPLAKTLGSIGVPLLIKVRVFHDDEADVYVASSPNVRGLNIEATTLDELRKEVELTLPDLIDLNDKMTAQTISHTHAHLSFCTPLHA